MSLLNHGALFSHSVIIELLHDVQLSASNRRVVAMALLGPERRRPTMYYSSSLPAAPAHARQLCGRGGGGRPGGEPAISFVCSCESTSKRALERARSGAADVPRLLLRQYVQESFGVPGGHGWSGADRRKGPEENKCGSLAMAGSWGSS